jgi:DnaJ homolog subfamily C member 28
MSNIADDRIEKAMERGEFNNLRGMGKPLQLEHDRMVPDEYRLAYRIMRDNNVEPEWIRLSKEVEERIESVRAKLRHVAQQYHAVQKKYGGKEGLEAVTARLAAMDSRDFALAEFRDEVVSLNKQIATLNLIVPVSHITRDLLDIQREITRVFP